jgi:oligoribonuclease NrnB/cAMP/cGMP phosphodiesterase (DHH superfamily)
MNVAIWTDNDLDGAGSALAIKLMYGSSPVNFTIQDVNDSTFAGMYRSWSDANYESFDKIYILDVWVPDEIVSLVDREKVIIIDHHKSHVDVKDRYKVAKAIIEDCSSCCKLIVEKFDRIFSKILTDKQRELFKIVDDYDSYTLKFPDTLKLNSIYHSYNAPKGTKFIERFANGLGDYTAFEQNAYKLFCNKLKDAIENATFFKGTLKGYNVISCVANSCINELAHYSLKKYNADIAIVVNTTSCKVSFRKKKNSCTIQLNKLAEILCNGGGHEYAAGGDITDNFLNFTKTLSPCT